MKKEVERARSRRILLTLRSEYPGVECWDVDGSGQHFVAEIEPSKDHTEYDRAVEVVIKSKPHKHLKMTQKYKVLAGTLELHVENDAIVLRAGDVYTVYPGCTHWATSEDEAKVEIYSTPGWTKDDHIEV